MQTYRYNVTQVRTPKVMPTTGPRRAFRAREGGLKAGMWSITTNPFRSARGRWKVFQRNLERLEGLVQRSEGQMELVSDLAEYRAARKRGAHAVLLSIQGGHALEAAPEGAAAASSSPC